MAPIEIVLLNSCEKSLICNINDLFFLFAYCCENYFLAVAYLELKMRNMQKNKVKFKNGSTNQWFFK